MLEKSVIVVTVIANSRLLPRFSVIRKSLPFNALGQPAPAANRILGDVYFVLSRYLDMHSHARMPRFVGDDPNTWGPPRGPMVDKHQEIKCLTTKWPISN